MKLAALPIVLLIAPLGAACTASPGRPGAATASADAPIPFVENDYDGALAQAKASGKPLFVDAWAPWCHTCLSMRSYVFTDPLLRARAGDFVWLSLDTERASSARFLEAFPMQVWPTLWVIDAKTVKPALKWLGSATPSEMADLLDDARSAIEHGDLGGEAAAAFERGNRATAEGKRDDAMREYRAALAVASPAWPRRGRVVEALVARLSEMQQNEACAELAASELPKLPAGTAVANVALSGIHCARHAEGGRAKALAPGLAQAAERLAVDDTLPILADDRSGLFEALVDYYKDEGRLTDVRVLALKWSEFLEGQASRASDAAARASSMPIACSLTWRSASPTRRCPCSPRASASSRATTTRPRASLALTSR